MSVPVSMKPEQQLPRQSRRRFWLIVGGVSIVVFIVIAVYVGFAAYSAFNAVKQNGSIPERYYLNIFGGDYTTAYSYLDRNATIDGQQVDQQSFTRLAKAADAQFGTARSIALSTASDATHVTVTVSRGSRTYDVHLDLKQENGTWKIISADGI
jgi:hypothetical protein